MEIVTRETALTAMCIFEHCLDTTYAIVGPVNSPSLEFFHRGEGICEARDSMINFVPFVDAAWDAAKETYHYAFDLEFVPAFINAVVATRVAYDVWTDLHLAPIWMEVARKMGASIAAAQDRS